MTKEMTVQKKSDPIMELIKQYQGSIANVLPGHMKAETVVRMAFNAVYKTPKLRECTKASLVNCILEASMLGLDIGRTAHIVPYGKTATFIPDYKGFIDLAHRSDRIQSFPFKPVYEKDLFEYEEGTTRYIRHKPFKGKGRGPLIAAYATVFFKHGGFDFEVVEQADIDAVKKRSPGARMKDSPWNQPDLEWTMWCKTAVRRLAKRVPQSPDLQRAAYLEEMAEAGLRQDIDHAKDIIDLEPLPTDALTDALQDNIKDKPEPGKLAEILDIEPKKEEPKKDEPPKKETPPAKEPQVPPEQKTAKEPELTQEEKDKELWAKEYKMKRSGFAESVMKALATFASSPYLNREGKKKWIRLQKKGRISADTPWPLDPKPEPTPDQQPEKTVGDDMDQTEISDPGASDEVDSASKGHTEEERPLFNEDGSLTQPPEKQEPPDTEYVVCPKTHFRVAIDACKQTCKVSDGCEPYQALLF